jgi:RsiW-degrading membrane proteinase PrsW (M82 family)
MIRSKTDSKSSLSSDTNKMSTTKKMSIFVLQPNALHAQWQGDKLNSVFQVSYRLSEIKMMLIYLLSVT